MINFKYLIFFPSITFGIVPAEIFPWSALYIFFKCNRIKVIIIFLTFIFILNLLPKYFFTDEIEFLGPFSSFISYINSIGIIFYILKYAKDIEINRLIVVLNSIFIFFVILSIIEYTSFLKLIDPYWQLLVPRGSLSKLEGARGVMGFSTEPSRFSYEIISMMVALYAVKPLNSIRYLIFGLVAIIASSSLTGIILYILFLFVLKPILLTLVSIIFIFLINSLTISLPERMQFINLFFSLDIKLAFDEVIYQSFHRLPVIISSINGLIINPFGYGLGNWFVPQFLNDFEFEILGGFSGSDFINRPTFIFSFISELGIIALIGLIALFYKYININRYSFYLLALCFITSDPGNPIPFAMLGIVSHYFINKNKNKIEI